MTEVKVDYQLLETPKPSNWVCYMFGSQKGYGIEYRPAEGNVPNIFVRFMMRICFDCRWERIKNG